MITGVEDLIANLERRAKLTPARVRLKVGYDAPHAVFVHENREMKLAGQPRKSGIGVYWGPRGRPGFLLDVAHEMSRDLVRFGVAQLRRGIGFATVLYWMGRRLENESRRNVPVEYGTLRDSSFTRVE